MRISRCSVIESVPDLSTPLQDLGAISMISSDAQAMGRIGEVTSRTWRTASKMKEFTGPLKGETHEGSDNERVKVSAFPRFEGFADS